MLKSIDNILNEIEIDTCDIRDFLYELSNKDLGHAISTVMKVGESISSCGKCLSACELNKAIDINSKLLNFLTLISNPQSPTLPKCNS